MAKEFHEYLDEVVVDQGEPIDWIEANRAVQEAELRMGIDRQREYGHSNISTCGELGVIVRAIDKANRAWTKLSRNLTSNKRETTLDSYGDLANYGTYAAMISRGWWELPFFDPEEDEPERGPTGTFQSWSEFHLDVGENREVLRRAHTDPGIESITYGTTVKPLMRWQPVTTELEAS